MTDRKQHWEDVYTNKSPLEVSWYQQEPAVSLRLIAASGLTKDAPLIDVGGGASLLVDRLLALGYTRLAVLDIAGQALAHARSRLGERAGAVAWYEADVTAFAPPHPFALWHDRAVFHFLTEATERRRYVETLRRTLLPDGQVVIAAFAVGGPTRCSGLPIVQYDAQRVCGELGAGFELLEQVDEAHVTPGAKVQAFSFFRFVRRG